MERLAGNDLPGAPVFIDRSPAAGGYFHGCRDCVKSILLERDVAE